MSSEPPPWKQLIDPTLPTNERVRLVKSIFSDRYEVEMLKHLSGNDAQAFVDVIYEASICVLLPLEDRSIRIP